MILLPSLWGAAPLVFRIQASERTFSCLATKCRGLSSLGSIYLKTPDLQECSSEVVDWIFEQNHKEMPSYKLYRSLGGDSRQAPTASIAWHTKRNDAEGMGK